MSDHFFVTLPSNSSMDIFPDNKITRFNTQLAKRISLQGNWECGLVEIHYPFSFDATSSELWVRYRLKPTPRVVIANGNTQVQGAETPEDTGESGVIHLNGGPYKEITSLMGEMKNNQEFSMICDVLINNGRIRIVPKPKVVCMTLSPLLQKIFHMPVKDLFGTTEGVDVARLDALIPSHMYVYTDIVEPQPVGDTLAPLLRIINVGKHGKMPGAQISYTFIHPHYIPLMKREFNRIEVDIRDDLGENVPFASGQLNVKLHFRKVSL